MAAQTSPIGYRLGVSHYWKTPYYTLKNLALSYSLHQYIKLIVYTFFIGLKYATKKQKIWIGVRIRDFFFTVDFNFWEFKIFNFFISLVGKLRFSHKRKHPRERRGKTKTGIFQRILVKRKNKASAKGGILQDCSSIGEIDTKFTMLYIYFKKITNIMWKNRVNRYPFLRVGKLFAATRKIKSNFSEGNIRSWLGSLRSPRDLMRRRGVSEYLLRSLRGYLKKVLKMEYVNLAVNFGWSFVRYMYFCYIFFTMFFAQLALTRNLARYYMFYRAGVIALYIQDITLLFIYLKRQFRYNLMKSIRDPNMIFAKFSNKMSKLPYRSFGILNTNIYFRGRSWGRKKTWTKLEKVSLARAGRPLSQLNKNFLYAAYHIPTKFGIYGLKFWLTYSELELEWAQGSLISRVRVLDFATMKFLLRGVGWLKI